MDSSHFKKISNQDIIHGGNINNLALNNYDTSTLLNPYNSTKLEENIGRIPVFKDHFFFNEEKLEIKTDLEEEIHYTSDMKSIFPSSLGLESYGNYKINSKGMAITYLDINYKRFISNVGVGEQQIQERNLGTMYRKQTLPLNIKMYLTIDDNINRPILHTGFNQDLFYYIDTIILRNINKIFCHFWNYRNDKIYFHGPNSNSKTRQKPIIYSLDGLPIKFKNQNGNLSLITDNGLNIRYKMHSYHYQNTNMISVSVSLYNIYDYLLCSDVYETYKFPRRRYNENRDESFTGQSFDLLDKTDIFTDIKMNSDSEPKYHQFLKLILDKCINIYHLETTGGIKYKVLNLNVKKSMFEHIYIKSIPYLYTTSIVVIYKEGDRIYNENKIDEFRHLIEIKDYPLIINDNCIKSIHKIYLLVYNLKYYEYPEPLWIQPINN